MAKFCGKCGNKLDEKTGLCPKCDVGNSEIDKHPITQNVDELTFRDEHKKESVKSVELTRKQKRRIKKVEKKANRTTGQKIRGFLLKLLAFVLVLTLFSSGIMSLLVYFNLADIPLIKRIYNKFDISYSAEISNRDIPETDTSGIVYSPPEEQDIVYFNGSHIIDSQILILTKDNKGEEHIKEFFKDRNYKIVGRIDQLNQYQVELINLESNDELPEIIDKLNSEDWVVSSSLDYVFETDTSDYEPNDSQWKGLWGEYPEGLNWGAEAINAAEAWDKRDEMSTVNVGLIDSYFDVSHEDLLFAEQPLGNVLAKDYINQMTESYKLHGSHVAGTMAASFDNNKGIAGICPKTNLYGVSMKGVGTQNYTGLMGWKVALTYLAVMKKCKVINISMGWDHYAFEASRNNTEVQNHISECANEFGTFIKHILDSVDEDGNHYDFVICKSAGNQNKTSKSENGYVYFQKDEDDDYEPDLRYYSYGDLKKQINGDNSSFSQEYQAALSRYIDRYNSNSLALDCGNVDARFDYFSAISLDEVKDRIIVVGEVKNNGTHKEGGFLWFGGTTIHDGYSICDFSQCGNRVDVLAPGDTIHSVKYGGGYVAKNWSGTSQATPHVSGVAGMLFALTPDISGDRVKKTIVDTATGSYGSEEYGLLNAGSAIGRNEDNREKNSAETEPTEEFSSNPSAERDIVLVLDVSGSMSGTPLNETKKAANKFIDTVLDYSANIGIVKYDDKAEVVSSFSTNGSALENAISEMGSGGSTNIEDGLATADSMLEGGSGSKKLIVLMSDGEPNEGKGGEDLIAYANELKEKGIYIYTLGFFESLSGKSSAQYLMEKIASEGCHYEVSDADSLVYFFGDIADQISGQKYIYVRIACPVDVSVSYEGESLDSSDLSLNTRTSFGTLTFEEAGDYYSYDGYDSSQNSNDTVKTLRLKEGVDYDISIVGTGTGRMNYSIGFMDDEGEYTDFRRFNNIRINRRTKIDTVAEVADNTVLNVDEDGDGKYDIKYRAEANGYGKKVDYSFVVYTILSLVGVLVLLIIVLIIHKKIKKKKGKVN